MNTNPLSVVSRRKFLAGTTAAMASVTILRSGLLKAAANSTPNIAAVGVGGKGWGDITETSKDGAANVVAFCDVETGGGRGNAKKKANSGYAAAAEKWPNAKR